jgi:hypothetical protein
MSNTEPLAILEHRSDSAEDWSLSTERTAVFSVRVPVEAEEGEGEGERVVVYTMPAKPNPGLALRYLKKVRHEGDLATSWLIETAVGEEGYEALCDDLVSYEGDAAELLRQIAERIQKIAMGGLRAPKG